jgi:asparagine synthase (glutamine-hydrolysing)
LAPRRKSGFKTPIARWFRECADGVLRPILLDPRAHERRLFDRDEMEALIAAHASGRIDASRPLLRWLTTELWFREFIDGGSSLTAASR